MKRKFPPLWTWATTLGLMLSFVLLIGSSGIVDLRHGFGPSYDSFKNRLEHLQSEVEINEGDQVVVLIGSSYTAMAVDHRAFFHQTYQQRHGGVLHVIKLYMYGCNAQKLQKLPEFFDMVSYLQPDLLCLEEHLLVIDEEQQIKMEGNIPTWISDFYLGINAMRNYFLPQLDRAEWHDLPTFEFFWKYHDNTYEADSLTTGPSPNFQVRSYASNERVNHRLKTYVPEHTDIVCISVPRAPYTEQVISKLRRQENYLTLRQQYEEQLGVDFWEFQDVLPYAMYSGDNHLNEVGMRRYSNWLGEQIVKHFHP